MKYCDQTSCENVLSTPSWKITGNISTLPRVNSFIHKCGQLLRTKIEFTKVHKVLDLLKQATKCDFCFVLGFFA